jgi:hypothetical protein
LPGVSFCWQSNKAKNPDKPNESTNRYMVGNGVKGHEDENKGKGNGENPKNQQFFTGFGQGADFNKISHHFLFSVSVCSQEILWARVK